MADVLGPDDERERRLDTAVLHYLHARAAGPVDRAAWLGRYPDLRDELDAYLAAAGRLDGLAEALRRLTGAAAGSDETLPFDGGAEPAGPAGVPAAVGPFAVRGRIGRGGMGVVYRAWHPALQCEVALKTLLAGAHADAQERERMRNEARAAARLHHPHIVRVFEVGEADGAVYLAMELVEGGNLSDWLGGTPLQPRAAAALALPLARAVHHAHENDVIHRDLKPANVLLQRRAGGPAAARAGQSSAAAAESFHHRPDDFDPKVTDFGLAKRLDDDSGQTRSGTVLGTPSYMAPEQAQGKVREVGVPADVYGLGALLYELLTGRPPFRGATPTDTLLQVVADEPVAPRQLNPKVPRDLETITLKCLEKDPRKRYASAAALADDLHAFLDHRPIQARPITAAARLGRLARRHPGASAAAALSALAALALFLVVAGYNRRLSAEVERTEAANQELHDALVRQTAERLDRDLLQLAAVPRQAAETLALRPDWTEAQLEAWLRRLVAQDERVYGSTAAFERKAFDGKQGDFALYVYRPGGKDLRAMRLRPPEYDYFAKDWYALPKARGSGRWSEPFIDHGAGEIPMVTYSAPFRRGGVVAGVATVDLSIEYFRVLADWLGESHRAAGSKAFVVSPSGTFISHYDDRFRMPRKLADVPEYAALGESILSGKAGSARGVDPVTGGRAAFRFAPVPSAGWALVTVTEESP